MTREIPVYLDATHIDEDTKVGFGFQSKLYFIDNKNTRTTRATAKQALDVLKVVTNNNPITINNTPITEAMLSSLATTYEAILSLNVTYEDTGAFIKTLAFNDYDYYPLVLDCPLQKLYIMNTDKVHDLTLNVSKDFIISDLTYFYHTTLGLDIDNTFMEDIYDFLLSYYSPTIYNEIASREDTSTPLYYNNKVLLSNYNTTSPLTYTLTINPNNVSNLTKLGDITKVDQDTKTITIIPQPDFSTFPTTEDKHVYISNLSTTIGADTYTADGEYTYSSKDTTNNTIQVTEALPFSYSFPYPKVYLQKPTVQITSISNPTASITVTSTTGFNVGDTVTIINQVNTANNGDYEIIGISGTTITFSTVPPVSLSENCGHLFKFTYIGEASLISNQVITLRENPLETVSANDLLKVEDMYDILVASVSGKEITTTTSAGYPNIVPDYTPSYPTLSYNKLAEIVNINITSSTLEALPVGEFTVDTYEQCQEYIALGEAGYDPYEYLSNGNLQVLSLPDVGTVPVIIKGLYSEFYS